MMINGKGDANVVFSLMRSRRRHWLLAVLGLALTALPQSATPLWAGKAVSGPGPTTPQGEPPPAVYLPLLHRGAFAFQLQNGTPVYLSNILNGFGCNYMGIAGRVFDSNQMPVIGLVVRLESDVLTFDAFTGNQPAIGPGGYEIWLGDAPVATTDVYSIHVRDTAGGALSATAVIPTFADCAKNLILVNWVAVD
jgi:hypothetical protein